MKGSLMAEIYELVKSLSKSEKRYFRLYTQFQSGDKSYLKLFEIIDGQKAYNEKEINRNFLTKHRSINFPAVKKYLFDQLIASLKSYGAYKDLDSDHTDLIETYKVLQYKGLHGQSGRLLQKIKSITLQDDAFLRHVYVLLLEYARERYNSDELNERKIYQIMKEKRHTLDIIENYTLVGDLLVSERLLLRKKLYCRTQAEIDELTELMAPALRTEESDMLSRTALAMRNVCLCDYYLAIGNPEKAFEISKSYLALRKNAGSSDKIDPTTILEHCQHLWLCIFSGIYQGFEEEQQKLKIFIYSIRNKEKFLMGYERWYNYSFIYYNRTGQFRKALQFRESEKETFTDIGCDMSVKAKITLLYFTAYNSYALKDYKQALAAIQEILNSANEEMEEYSFGIVLLMFIHYDLGNHELLEYQVRSAQRLMLKRERLYDCEKLMLEFFKTAGQAISKTQKKQHLETLQHKVAGLFKTFYERGFSFYFDIEAWIKAKLRNEEFAAQFSEKSIQ